MITDQWSLINDQWSLLITHYSLLITKYQLLISDHWSLITNYHTDYWLPMTDDWLLITDDWLQIRPPWRCRMSIGRSGRPVRSPPRLWDQLTPQPPPAAPGAGTPPGAPLTPACSTEHVYACALNYVLLTAKGALFGLNSSQTSFGS